MYIDTHTHLYSSKFADDRGEVLLRAREAGVDLALLPAIDSSTHSAMLELERTHPEQCIAMIGLHPVSVKENFEEELAEVRRLLDSRPWVAIGEIGMDLYWDKSFRAQQETAFLRQCEWAVAFGLPISIHARESIDELLALLEEIGDTRLRGVFHCFTGDVEQLRRVIDLGFYVGIGGVATFKNGGMEEVIRVAPENRLLLETDAPYLAPSPHRGKRNETAYLPLIAKKIADVRGISIDEVANFTSRNAGQLFDLDRFIEAKAANDAKDFAH